MAEESAQTRRPKALLEDLADFKIAGKLSLNLRIFLEPVGILKFILIFTTLFALSLTAGFNSDGGANKATCQDGNTTYTLTITFSYPYHPPGYSFVYNPPISRDTNASCFAEHERRIFTGSAEYFVAMSTFSFIFAILSFPFYFFFYVPRYDIAKYLSIIDLIITCLLVFFYIFADIAWAAGINQLDSFHRQLLRDRRNLCLNLLCQREDEAPSPEIQSSVQLSFSVLFGWVSFMLLAASIWFIYKDTIVHQERMGPIYRLPFCSKKRGGGSGAPENTYQPDAGTYTPKKDEDVEAGDQEEASVDIGPPPESRADETVEY